MSGRGSHGRHGRGGHGRYHGHGYRRWPRILPMYYPYSAYYPYAYQPYVAPRVEVVRQEVPVPVEVEKKVIVEKPVPSPQFFHRLEHLGKQVRDNRRRTGIIVGSVVGGVLLLVLIIVLITQMNKR